MGQMHAQKMTRPGRVGQIFPWCAREGIVGSSFGMQLDPEPGPPPRRHQWPWFVLAAAVLGVALAVFWMTFAVRRTRELRESNPLPYRKSSNPRIGGLASGAG